MRNNGLRSSMMAAFIAFFLQFVTVPIFGDLDKTGKEFFFVFFVLVAFLIFISTNRSLSVSSYLWPILFFWVMLTLSALQAKNSYGSFLFLAAISVGLLYLLLVINQTSRDPRFPLKVVDFLMLYGVVAAVLGLYEYFHFLWLGPTNGMLIPFLLPPDLYYRVYGPYGQPNLFALSLTLSLLGFFFRYIHTIEVINNRFPPFLKYVPFSLVALIFFMTGSRAGLLSIFLVVCFMFWLVSSGRYLAGDRQGRAVFVRLCVCLAGAFALYRLAPLLVNNSHMVNPSLGAVTIGSDGRFVFWTSSILIFRDHPLLGVGLDRFKFFLPSHTLEAHDLLGFVPYEAMGFSNWSHNELLQVLCEGGIFAFLTLIGLVASFLVGLGRNFFVRLQKDRPLFLYSHLFILPFLIQAMFSWPLRHPALLALFFTFLGICSLNILYGRLPSRRVR